MSVPRTTARTTRPRGLFSAQGGLLAYVAPSIGARTRLRHCDELTVERGIALGQRQICGAETPAWRRAQGHVQGCVADTALAIRSTTRHGLRPAQRGDVAPVRCRQLSIIARSQLPEAHRPRWDSQRNPDQARRRRFCDPRPPKTAQRHREPSIAAVHEPVVHVSAHRQQSKRQRHSSRASPRRMRGLSKHPPPRDRRCDGSRMRSALPAQQAGIQTRAVCRPMAGHRRAPVSRSGS
jgi:hypothetical protein